MAFVQLWNDFVRRLNLFLKNKTYPERKRSMQNMLHVQFCNLRYYSNESNVVWKKKKKVKWATKHNQIHLKKSFWAPLTHP